MGDRRKRSRDHHIPRGMLAYSLRRLPDLWSHELRHSPAAVAEALDMPTQMFSPRDAWRNARPRGTAAACRCLGCHIVDCPAASKEKGGEFALGLQLT